MGKMSEDEMNSALDRLRKAMAAIHDDAKEKGFKKGIGGQAIIKCPICETGNLRYSMASSNGHIHAACSTDDCIRFMQ